MWIKPEHAAADRYAHREASGELFHGEVDAGSLGDGVPTRVY